MNLITAKWPGINRKRRIVTKGSMVIGITTLALFCVVGIVLASSGEAGGTKGWVATDTYRVMNFTVLAVALFLVMRKPVSKALNARIKGIEEHLVELEAKKKEAEKQLAAYNEKFATLEAEADKLIDEYIRQGNEAKERILVEAQAAAEKLEEQARRNIEHEFKQTKLKLKEEILVKALAKAEALIKSKISAQDHEKLVEEYLEKVVA
ncbi:MAG: ATP synthase F0 subunit B [Desulfobacterales bacterium]|uniref:ATP synthase subunit b n=1 Tax=Candidatus Desulfatibia vada TaxID=2841696 RepID=A0A8J6P1F5_9BACT|nr:ATP synthase F0 subunit B [Candidatus Desulfatibia vada]MBL6971368.1 ATP synthase F0 subunit B [Desulfobacterales bacterium]